MRLRTKPNASTVNGMNQQKNAAKPTTIHRGAANFDPVNVAAIKSTANADPNHTHGSLDHLIAADGTA